MPLVCGSRHTVCSYHKLTSHVHNYSTNVQKALTHEHPSGESADKVKGKGVFFFSILEK